MSSEQPYQVIIFDNYSTLERKASYSVLGEEMSKHSYKSWAKLRIEENKTQI